MPETRHVGPFLLLQPLGTGARGHVWRARDSRSGEERALKLAALGDAAACARLRNEALVGAAVSHPRLVQVFSGGEDPAAGVAWLAMECLPGGPAPLSLATFGQLLEALACLHAGGIVHADIKPANLLATSEGGLKLGDFGLARRAGSAAPAHGTPRYMSPEQMRGCAIGPASDVFSAGAILFELACGRKVFDGTPFDIVRQVLAASPSLPLPPGAPLEALVRRALARDPAERFADGGEFLIQFRALCQLA